MPYPNYPNVPGTWSQNQYNQYRYQGQGYSNYPSYPNQQRQQGTLIWVSGIDGAKAYPTMPNTDILLLDNTDPYVYLKSTDAANFPTIERFRIVKDTVDEPETTATDRQYVTHDELSQLSSKIDGLMVMLDEMRPREYKIDVKGAQNVKSDLQQLTATATDREPDHGSSRAFEGGYDRRYEGDFRSDAG